jgi:hypothetical protein
MMTAPLGMILAVLMAAAQSGGALVGERVDGMRRVCAYEDQTRGRLAPPLQVRVGLGEPCPFRYPRPRRPRPPEIPSLATLEGQSYEGGRTICRYTYLGIHYSRTIAASQTCPYTPNFID